MIEQYLKIDKIPTVIYGEESEKVYLFIHGKCGYKEEAKKFANIVCKKGWQVISIDLPEHGERKSEKDLFNPWSVVPELECVMNYIKKRWDNISLRANSIGAWFSMLSFKKIKFKKCLFVSPIVDMEILIKKMMLWANVTEEILLEKKEIQTEFGEQLSWEYLQYAKKHKIKSWKSDTNILYGDKDNLTDKMTIDCFVSEFKCNLFTMENGEHWFHTENQLLVLKKWVKQNY